MSKTSNAVKQRYNEKVYKQIKVSLKKDFVEEWEQKLNIDSISKSEFIRNAIREYVGKTQ